METFEINGIQYQKNPPAQPRQMGRGMSKIMLMSAMFSGMAGMYGGGSNYSRKRPQVNIIKEFELIQQKKSNLSKNDRDWVEWQFNRMYSKVEVGTMNDSKVGGEL